MFRFEKYEDSLEEQWDKFITEKSINGTFLQSRRFFNYHPAGRFKDVSLVVYNEKNNIAALIPACELEQDIEDDYTYDTSKIEAFLLPKGTVAEVYATTLHYAPCSV